MQELLGIVHFIAHGAKVIKKGQDASSFWIAHQVCLLICLVFNYVVFMFHEHYIFHIQLVFIIFPQRYCHKFHMDIRCCHAFIHSHLLAS